MIIKSIMTGNNKIICLYYSQLCQAVKLHLVRKQKPVMRMICVIILKFYSIIVSNLLLINKI